MFDVGRSMFKWEDGRGKRGPDVLSCDRNMTDDLTADEVRNLLKLELDPTCGFVRVTFISEKQIAAGGLPAPFADGRPAGSALYFMVTPGAPVQLHSIISATISSIVIISVIRSRC
jgi:hypothetical protein